MKNIFLGIIVMAVCFSLGVLVILDNLPGVYEHVKHPSCLAGGRSGDVQPSSGIHICRTFHHDGTPACDQDPEYLKSIHKPTPVAELTSSQVGTSTIAIISGTHCEYTFNPRDPYYDPCRAPAIYIYLDQATSTYGLPDRRYYERLGLTCTMDICYALLK